MNTDSDTMQPYEIRQVIASFHDAEKFENATDVVEKAGISRSAISLMASHDAIKSKFGHRFVTTGDAFDDKMIPQVILSDRKDVKSERAFALQMPVYIGGAGAGMAILATGGTLAFAAAIAAATAAAGAGIGALFSRAVAKHHGDFLEKQLKMGSLLLTVDLRDVDQEKRVIELLTNAGGEDVHAITITRYWDPQRLALSYFNPYIYSGIGLSGMGGW